MAREARLGMSARLLLGTLWLALVLEAFLVSPAARADSSQWLLRLVTGQWADEEVWVVVLFNLMGVWPLAMAGLLADRLRGWPPLWPFAVMSMALGGFVLLPGLLLAGDRASVASWQRALMHPALRAALAVVVVGLMVWGVLAGDVGRFVQVWQTEPFVHVMALDFVALWLASVVVARENSTRGWLALVPLLGALRVAGAAAGNEG